MRLAKQDVQLRAVFTYRNHLFDYAVRFFEFAILNQGERERIVERRVL